MLGSLQPRLVPSPVLQVAEGRSRPSSRADSGDGQAAAVSSGTPGGRSDSESIPVLQNSEKPAAAAGAAKTAEAAVAPPAGGESAGSILLSASGDGEEKRDQSKEEPLLELRQQEGRWRTFPRSRTLLFCARFYHV